MRALLPSWLETAKKFDGLREVQGPKHNGIILGWLEKLNAWWNSKAWADYGSLLRRDRLAPGAILVFDRAGGGHVGFYVGEDAGHYFVLGGNQGNAVNVMKLGKTRLVASRWPKGEPVIGKPVYMKGGKVSINEA